MFVSDTKEGNQQYEREREEKRVIIIIYLSFESLTRRNRKPRENNKNSNE